MCCAVGKYFTPTLKKQSFDSVQGHWITFSYISSLEWSATPANVPLTVIITYPKYRLHLERFHRLVNLRFKYGIQEYLSSSSSQEIKVDTVSITNDSRSQCSTLHRTSSAKTPSVRNSPCPTYDGKKVATMPMKIVSPLLRQWLEAWSVTCCKTQLRCYRSKTRNSSLCGRILRISRALLCGRVRILGYWDMKAPLTSIRRGISTWRAPSCLFLRENIPLTCGLNHLQWLPGTSHPTTGSESSMEAHQITSLSRCR